MFCFLDAIILLLLIFYIFSYYFIVEKIDSIKF